jgi:hypothetical protein
VKVVVLSGYPNVGAGLGNVPHTYAAKPASPDMVKFLLNSSDSARKTAHSKFAGNSLTTA